MDQQLARHIDKLLNMLKKKTSVVDRYSDIDPAKLVLTEQISHGSSSSSVTFGNKARYDGRLVSVEVLEWGEEDDDDDDGEARVAQRALFKQGIAIWKTLNHPNIAEYVGATTDTDGLIGLPSNAACVIIEHLSGGTLKFFLVNNRKQKLTLHMVVQLALHLARGLSYLHSRGIVHRNVKPKNLFVDDDHVLKMIDFRVAQVEDLILSHMTGITGTLSYMAPEVMKSTPYNRKCDVYSFGICLWEIYCFQIPYSNLNCSELVDAVANRNLRPDIPKHCPSSLRKVMTQCWDANPEKRPEMKQVVSLLEAIDTSKGGARKPLWSQGWFKFLRSKDSTRRT